MSARVPSASFRFINRETFKTPYAKWPNSKNLFCDALRDVGGMKKLLPPLPIARIEKTHKYIWEPTGEQLAFSTTQVCNTKTPEELANIERYRAKWQPRGETAHYALQQRMLGNDKIEMGDYEDWIKPLMDWNCGKISSRGRLNICFAILKNLSAVNLTFWATIINRKNLC